MGNTSLRRAKLVEQKVDENIYRADAVIHALDEAKKLYGRSLGAVDIEALDSAKKQMQEIRHQLTTGMIENATMFTHPSVGIKRRPMLDDKPFQKANKQFYSQLVDEKAEYVLSWLKEYLQNPISYPYKTIEVDSGFQEIVDEDDEVLQTLQYKWGDEAYKMVITALKKMKRNEQNSEDKEQGIELNIMPFHKVCQDYYFTDQFLVIEPEDERLVWEHYLVDPNWSPFKYIEVNNCSQEILDEDDVYLQELKEYWGDEVYEMVTTALQELKEDDQILSGWYTKQVLWNFKEERRAAWWECVDYVKFIVDECKGDSVRGLKC